MFSYISLSYHARMFIVYYIETDGPSCSLTVQQYGRNPTATAAFFPALFSLCVKQAVTQFNCMVQWR